MIKKIILVGIALGYAVFAAGCSRTWSGVQQDASELLLDTKEVIHEVTAPQAMKDTTIRNSDTAKETIENKTEVIHQKSSQELHPAIPTAN
jgi:hypothetical protein